MKSYLGSIMDGGPRAHGPHQRANDNCPHDECNGSNWEYVAGRDHYGTRLGINRK